MLAPLGNLLVVLCFFEFNLPKTSLDIYGNVNTLTSNITNACKARWAFFVEVCLVLCPDVKITCF